MAVTVSTLPDSQCLDKCRCCQDVRERVRQLILADAGVVNADVEPLAQSITPGRTDVADVIIPTAWNDSRRSAVDRLRRHASAFH